MDLRWRVASFRVRNIIFRRKAGQALSEPLGESEKEFFPPTRRSFFGEAGVGDAKSADPGNPALASYGLFVNRLAFSEDGRDDYICAEHYVMLGNWDRDPDRYPRLQDIAWSFVRSLYGEEITTETIDSWICAPENTRALVGTGTPDDSTSEGIAQQERLAQWVRLLEDEQVMECVIASYHPFPFLRQYP